MKTIRPSRPAGSRLASACRLALLGACAVLSLWTASMDPAAAMDTDIFAALSTPGATPNVLIVLDNTANWANQSQHWPGGIQQGQAEVDAIRQAIQKLPGNINVGLMEMVTGNPNFGSDHGGFVRYAVSPMGQAQGATATADLSSLSNILTTIYNTGVNGANAEKNSETAPFGPVMNDVYNYFSGATPSASSGDVNPSLADSNGYTSNYTQFKSPLSPSTSCATNYVIFIGNAGTLHADDAANLSALAAAGGDTTQLKLPVYSATTQTTSTNLGYSSSCFSSQPTGTPTDYASLCPPNSSTYDSCTYSATDTTNVLPACASGTQRYSVVANGATSTTSTSSSTATTSGTTSSCYSKSSSWKVSSDTGGMTCPTSSTVTSGSTTTSTTINSCSYAIGNAVTGGSCNGNQSKFQLTQTVSKTVTTVTQIPPQTVTLGNTSACYSSISSCSTSDYTCPAGATCTCSTPTTTTGFCPSGSRYQALGNITATMDTPTGTYATDTATYNADEWARFLHTVGVPVGTAPNQTYQTVSTYTIDVYNDQPDAGFSGLMASMARAGGGKYFAAMNETAILSALNSIFSEIQAVNSTFASAALPISATNRAQNANQVYIGMFRPDQTDHPRWFGNLKRYQVDTFNGYSDLGGADGQPAVSSTTGFVAPCAESWWSTDSSSYWYDVTNNQPRIFITQASSPGTAWQSSGDDSNFAKGTCGTTGTWSDLPDGPTVEKGAAAQMLRNQGSRNMYTVPAGTSGPTSLTAFNTTNVTGISSNSTVNANVVNFIAGQDVTGEIAGVPSTAARPSIHGEVIHSRPLPIDYGGSTGVVVYYGAGDGVYHAVSGSTGNELWSFVAPETYAQLQRLMDNQPLIQAPYPTPPGQTQVSGTTAKQFYFDGSTGQYQNADNSKVWIFPAMRRGGRMLYGFDVTRPATPTLKWRIGCPDLADDTGCTAGMSGIGQTWSTPQVATVNGYTVGGAKAPVLIVGGGYDGCEDADSATPSCTDPKGATVYVIDADSGAVIKSFDTNRSVIADPALVDLNFDGVVDAAYIADTGGNIYRIDFPTTATDTSTWAIHRVAYTNVTPSNSYRKFEFAPAVLPYQGKVYVAISSGDREHPLSASYPYTTPVVNRFYVYLDDPSRATATDLDGPSMIDETATAPTCTSPGVLPGGTYVGWHMDLNSYGTGEQGVTSPIIIGGMVSFSTNRPVVSGAMCSTSLGEARGYWVNLLNGSGAIGVSGTCGGKLSQTFIGGGLPPSPVAATVSVNGVQQTIVIGSVSRDGSGPSSAIGAQQVRPPITTKRTRTYWKSNTDTR